MAAAEIEHLVEFFSVHFGPDVAAVFEYLSKNSGSTFQSLLQNLRIDRCRRSFFPAENVNFSNSIRVIKYYQRTGASSQFATEIPRSKAMTLTQRCLAVLLNHDIATVPAAEQDSLTAPRYCLQPDSADFRRLVRCPHLLVLVRKQTGTVGEQLMERLLTVGSASAKHLFEQQQEQQEQLLASLNTLLRLRFARRRESSSGDEFAELSTADLGDCLLAPNTEQLLAAWRSSLLCAAAAARSQGGGVQLTLAAMLDIVEQRLRQGVAASPESEVLAHADVVAAAAGAGVDRETAGEHIDLLVDDNFVERLSASAGGQFRICYQSATMRLAQDCVVSLIRARLGPQAVRIFNTLYTTPNLSQAELESQTLIGGRDCKELLYKLLADGFVHCSELSKAADFSQPRPNTAHYLFHVNAERAVRACLPQLFAAQLRLLQRRGADAAANRRLLEKRQRVDALVANFDRQLAACDDDQREELQEQRSAAEQLLTPAERQLLADLDRRGVCCCAGELLLEETVFLLQLFLQCAAGKTVQ